MVHTCQKFFDSLFLISNIWAKTFYRENRIFQISRDNNYFYCKTWFGFFCPNLMLIFKTFFKLFKKTIYIKTIWN
ncbi:unnamed protein product [Blepharisma stoltei]|uniref:Uncharacterized protein n=1 Tax=Blepharisma stoltei TaxID=1481888 RepID=A0AAU9J763_9CILI|nr:unnamed protein product [Blepharisma stoltei]